MAPSGDPCRHPIRSRRLRLLRACPRREDVHEVGKGGSLLVIEQPTVFRERAVRLAYGKLVVDDVRPDDAEDLRVSARDQTAPNRPVEAPITATGFPRSALSGNGRDAQARRAQAYAFATVGTIMLWGGIASFIAALCLSVLVGFGFWSLSCSR